MNACMHACSLCLSIYIYIYIGIYAHLEREIDLVQMGDTTESGDELKGFVSRRFFSVFFSLQTPLSYGEAHPMPGLRRTVVEAFHDSQKQNLSLVGINNIVNALAATERFKTRLAGTGADTERFAA